jgi:hypothetical protein
LRPWKARRGLPNHNASGIAALIGTGAGAIRSAFSGAALRGFRSG